MYYIKALSISYVWPHPQHQRAAWKTYLTRKVLRKYRSYKSPFDDRNAQNSSFLPPRSFHVVLCIVCMYLYERKMCPELKTKCNQKTLTHRHVSIYLRLRNMLRKIVYKHSPPDQFNDVVTSRTTFNSSVNKPMTHLLVIQAKGPAQTPRTQNPTQSRDWLLYTLQLSRDT